MKVITGKGIDCRCKEFKLANEFYRRNKTLTEVTDKDLQDFIDKINKLDFDKFKDFAKRVIILNHE